MPRGTIEGDERRSDRMERTQRKAWIRGGLVAAAIALGAGAALAAGAERPPWPLEESRQPVVVAQAPVDGSARALPGPVADVQLEERQGYNTDYLFGMSRALANSTVSAWAKPVLFIFTVPLDIALLPFAAIGGFF
jgi:hypothetical protein